LRLTSVQQLPTADRTLKFVGNKKVNKGFMFM